MRRIVFAGPSLHREDRLLHGNIEIRPPARKGDLLVAARDGADIIGLVDGIFEIEPSVWHKEILYCLSRGITVAGAASMGALRAAECASFGMIGIGSIFFDYHGGRRTADADVAVLHAPAELHHAALTLALVDAEETVDRMEAAGAITPSEAHAALAAARNLHFKDRSWNAILGSMASEGVSCENIGKHLASFRVDRKRDDCRELLEFVNDFRGDSRTAPDFELQNSAFLDALLRSVSAGAKL